MILKKHLKDTAYISRLNELYNISHALRHCIILDDNFADNINFQLNLTPTGNKLFNYLKKENPAVNNCVIYLAIFFDFYYDKLYFDIEKFDIENLYLLIENWISQNKIKYPWIYGKELYDKYFDEFNNQEEDLSFQDTVRLLENTSKGVFQIENLIIGPLGITKSTTNRRIMPTNEIHLWHCPDPSCPSFHKATLNNSDDSKILGILDDIDIYNDDKELFNITPVITRYKGEYYDPYSLEGLYELIVNAFGAEEHRSIVSRLLKKESIRDLLPSKFKKGSAEEICRTLSKDECLNVLLICDNKTLFRHIEDLIFEGDIIIPNTEVRSSYIFHEYGHYDTYLQCNKLGIRVNSNANNIANLKLKKLLKDIYNDSPLRENLNWSLRRFDQSLSLDQKLDMYIYEDDPLKIINEIILNGPTQLERASKLLLGKFEAHNNVEEEKRLVEKIAWKLGYEINLYPNFLAIFWKNLSAFKNDVLLSNIYNESDKARIRSSAVNLFVSMEEILQQSLSFVTWALLSDHYIDTKFKYIYEDARQFMVNELDNYEYTNNEFLKLDLSGKNTLYPLIHGFSALLKKCDSIISDSTKYKRPKKEFPSFYQEDPLKIFPFEHKKFILDISPSNYSKLKEILSLVPTESGKGKIMDIRNKLQHQREDFPLQDEILTAITSIEKCFSILENEGIYPDVYLFKKFHNDEYNRKKIFVYNYKGNEIQFFSSSELRGSHLPSLYKPLVCIKSIMLGYTNHPVTFSYLEKSNYQSYWKNYPRKKHKEN
ncbi:hypothetical protein R1T16_09140 [Flavobacterium sp. DG1-102-2]|uniref:hypothetical protein n=1 Tax=Flavobacterium sp. DG1-102-2 TaxID=3081663 RepID=UPI00294A43F2|nr:hypothetical protein [Flavobacterium sp. DG1-102-2]MDV6168587.1 hypothetical protein [Flavobacterium sp. DG1-102-2]